ncbi:MAG TPA: amino acid adenylation domain-containing protein [Candidatus Dormibacteraeota bacterium]
MSGAVPVVPVHDHVRRAAGRRPDAVALVGERRVTYAELDARSNAFARALWRHSAERGDRIALWLPKSHAAVVAIYGALKAGCAYVPLDPEQPPGRAGSILGDAEPTVLVTDTAHLGQLASRGLPGSLVLVVLVDASGPSLEGGIPVLPFHTFAGGSTQPLADAAVADDLAILLYTSGSTGVPKGVRITFRNLHTFVSWAIREMDLRESDVFANHAGLHFDLSTFDLFAAAAVGAAVWIVSEEEARVPDALADGLTRHGVTVWYSVPSILCLMVAAGSFDGVSARALRYVLFAGEVFPIKQLRELRARLPGAALYNLYGPTETNVCTYHRVNAIDGRESPVPIGRPLEGLEAWIVDELGEPCGDGEIGELVVRGPCVTPGYWRRTGYEAEGDHRRGIHPTGDLVSIEDGEYVYHGRKDRMIKVNGFRVELGEIEAALLQHESVAEAAVVAARIADSTRLVAFYSSAPTHEGVSLLQMKAHCRDRLPRYMVPHALTRLVRLPRNANGKIDLVRLAELAGRQRPVNQ